MLCGVTVITETTGGGRCGAGASLEQPAASKAQKQAIAARPTAGPPVIPIPGHCCINSESFALLTLCRVPRERRPGNWPLVQCRGLRDRERRCLELEPEVDAVLVGPHRAERAAGLDVLAGDHSTHEHG